MRLTFFLIFVLLFPSTIFSVKKVQKKVGVSVRRKKPQKLKGLTLRRVGEKNLFSCFINTLPAELIIAIVCGAVDSRTLYEIFYAGAKKAQVCRRWHNIFGNKPFLKSYLGIPKIDCAILDQKPEDVIKIAIEDNVTLKRDSLGSLPIDYAYFIRHRNAAILKVLILGRGYSNKNNTIKQFLDPLLAVTKKKLEDRVITWESFSFNDLLDVLLTINTLKEKDALFNQVYALGLTEPVENILRMIHTYIRKRYVEVQFDHHINTIMTGLLALTNNKQMRSKNSQVLADFNAYKGSLETYCLNGYPLLHHLSKHNCFETPLRAILASAIVKNIDLLSYDGMTALQSAARYCASKIVPILIENGADVKKKTGTDCECAIFRGLTPLEIASLQGSVPCVTALLRYDAQNCNKKAVDLAKAQLFACGEGQQKLPQGKRLPEQKQRKAVEAYGSVVKLLTSSQ